MNLCFLAALQAATVLNPKGRWMNQYTKDMNLRGFLSLGLEVSTTAGCVLASESRSLNPKP